MCQNNKLDDYYGDRYVAPHERFDCVLVHHSLKSVMRIFAETISTDKYIFYRLF